MADTIVIQAPQNQIDELHDLQQWLADGHFHVREDTVPAPKDPRGQSMAVVPVLLLILAAPAVVEGVKKLAESLHVYIKSRIEANRPKLTITLASEGGRKITLELYNPQTVPELTQKLLALSGGGTDGSGGGGSDRGGTSKG
jgi:hypothetical protein